MEAWLLVVLSGLAALTLATAQGAYNIPEEGDEALDKGFTWEEAPDGRKFRVYVSEQDIPHGFNKKVFIKRTAHNIIKYIRLKKCGCHVKTTKKVWVGKHRSLWYNGPRQAKVNFVRAPKRQACGCSQCRGNSY